MTDQHTQPVNTQKPHQYWMQGCISLAKKALPDDVPVGAIIIDADGALLAEGYNRRERDKDPTGHAELMALKTASEKLGNWRLSGCTLYVTLEPCPMCAAAIAQARVSRVVFGAYDPVMGACGSVHTLLPGPNQCEVFGGILEAGCGELLKTFFRKS